LNIHEFPSFFDALGELFIRFTGQIVSTWVVIGNNNDCSKIFANYSKGISNNRAPVFLLCLAELNRLEQKKTDFEEMFKIRFS
jgi:hypothetical protein